jgi:D-alanyl-D-alanine carboxypeptidase/D-alanyl-D-alanine-endopeptidase (penicillin-binding protein 4)
LKGSPALASSDVPVSAPRSRLVTTLVLALLLALAVGPVLVLVDRPVAAQSDEGDPPSEAAPPGGPVTPVLSARRAPGLLQGSIADPALAAAVRGTIDRNPDTWCLLVEDAGRPVLSVNPDTALAPASLTKLLTGTALLEHFGPDHRLRTTMVAAGPPVDGVVDGDLHLVGGGDPLLTTPGYAQSFDDPNQPYTDANALVDALVAAGVTEVRGDVVGDDSRYDAERWVATWPTRYQSEPSIGPISALAVNDGFTGYTSTPDRSNASRRAGDPPALAAQTLVTLMEARGIAVGGSGSAGSAPAGATEVAGLDSAPMREMVGEMVLASDNNTAEMLVKELGLSTSGQGTTAAGLAAVGEILGRLGLVAEGAALRDGSGLDPETRVTCSMIRDALARAGRAGDLAAGLAVGGETGTLRKRMGGSSATGRVVAKTGTLNSVNALAGWADTIPGATIGFVGIGNGTDSRGTAAADAFAEALVTYPQGPPLDVLGPR